MTTCEFCASELNKYMQKMTDSSAQIQLLCEKTQEDIFVEHYEIDVTGGKGSIRANRPRALLLGVYDFLRRLGCRFLRPGEKGEVVPRKALRDITVHASVTPSARHRGITIEGAVSLENVLDIVDWAPKAGFNSYFLQFRTSFEFFDRWYRAQGQTFTEAQSAAFVQRIIAAIRLRDMLYHAVGHGWTSACVGIDANGWKNTDIQLSEDKKQMLAEVGGERKFFNGIPLNTNLCYSNAAVRRRMACEVADYAQAHPEIDVLHFWLADDANNVCECDACRTRPLADWYVMMLNEIDEQLSARNLAVKICFLVYLDLYWAPEHEQIRHPERFIMMFAPIFRSYTTSYRQSGEGTAIEYVYNKVVYPHNAASYLRFLDGWKKCFDGDCFDFDYHLMWDIYRDFGGERLAEVLYDDIRSLEALGMSGYMSCQLQRAFYPNGLAFYLMGRALSDNTLSYEQIRDEYYRGAFGEQAAFAASLYADIERTVSFAYMKEEEKAQKALLGFKEAQKLLAQALAHFPSSDNAVWGESLAILRFAAENILRFVNVLVLQLEGADEAAINAAEAERHKFFNDGELRFQPYVDGFYQNMIVGGLVSDHKTGIFA